MPGWPPCRRPGKLPRTLAAHERRVARDLVLLSPPPEARRPGLARFPWLGEGFGLAARAPGACPGLSRTHLFSHAAMAGLGAIASDIPGASIGAERLAQRIAAHLFREDIGVMRGRLEAFAEPEPESTPFFAAAAFQRG